MEERSQILQHALNELIERYNHFVFGLKFNEDKYESIEDRVVSGGFVIHYRVASQAGKSHKAFDFEIDENGAQFCAGLIGYLPILYTKNNQGLRDELLKDNKLKGILTFPAERNTHSAIAIVFIGETGEKTWFATCENIEQAAKLILSINQKDKKFHYVEKVSPENLLPEYYSEEHERINEVLKDANVKPLKELAEIIPGKAARSDIWQDDGIPYLRARDIQKGTIQKASICLPFESAMTFSKQLLQDGDILLTRNFGQRKLALVTEEDLPAIASNALYIIRPFAVSEGYLYRYLTSDTGNAVFNTQLKRLEKGTVVAAIGLSDLADVKVPIYDEETMAIIESVNGLNDKIGIETALDIIESVSKDTQKLRIQKVYEELITAGWDKERLFSGGTVLLESGQKWHASYYYNLADGAKVFIEVKDNITASREWASAIK